MKEKKENNHKSETKGEKRYVIPFVRYISSNAIYMCYVMEFVKIVNKTDYR